VRRPPLDALLHLGPRQPVLRRHRRDGKFEIKGLPAGEYEIEAVHEKLKSQTGKITVKDGEKATLDLSYKG
jgi:hypothetical protein